MEMEYLPAEFLLYYSIVVVVGVDDEEEEEMRSDREQGKVVYACQ